MGDKDLTKEFNDESKADRPDAMTEAEYEAAFAEMADDYFFDREPQENPGLLYVTGLPGAGKSTFVKMARSKPPANEYILVNFDDLRVYHPRYEQHVRKDAINASARIDTAVEKLIGWLCEEAARRKVDVVLDDAAMGAEMTKIVLSPFQQNGYEVNAVVVAAPIAVARQSVHLRFEETYAAAKKGEFVIPRWVNTTEQDNAPAALVETVETIEEMKLAKQLLVIDRKCDLLYSTGLHAHQASAGEVVKGALTRDLTDEEVGEYQDNAERIAELMKKRTAPVKAAPRPKISEGDFSL